jgi:predicted acylesterase/phospholipase RssA
VQNKPPAGSGPNKSTHPTPTATPLPAAPAPPSAAPLHAASAPPAPADRIEAGAVARRSRVRRPSAAASETVETAVVITGAVAQGAFAAGALEVLARQNLPIRRVVATSAGALTGTLFAAGICAGRVEDAATALVDLWAREAHWRNALDLSLRDVWQGRGLSTTRSVHRVLRTAVDSMVTRVRQAVELDLIATALQGNPVVRRYEQRTSAEVVFRFREEDFETRRRRDRIYNAAMASAAFPGLYAPVHVPGVGDCIDGGAVNNAPIKRALAHSNIRRVIVISNTPRLVRTPPLAGAWLAEHIVGTVLHERLYRDLREAGTVNHQLRALEMMVPCGISAEQLAAVKTAIGWQHRRGLSLVEIRPRAPLRGGAFTALSHRRLREEYIEEGRCAAEEALATPVYHTSEEYPCNAELDVGEDGFGEIYAGEFGENHVGELGAELPPIGPRL